jgi:hypothetical protein
MMTLKTDLNCVFLPTTSSEPHELDVERFTPHNTTCSNDTFARGFGQKVSLFLVVVVVGNLDFSQNNSTPPNKNVKILNS